MKANRYRSISEAIFRDAQIVENALLVPAGAATVCSGGTLRTGFDSDSYWSSSEGRRVLRVAPELRRRASARLRQVRHVFRASSASFLTNLYVGSSSIVERYSAIFERNLEAPTSRKLSTRN
jgi:hypothetical protein